MNNRRRKSFEVRPDGLGSTGRRGICAAALRGLPAEVRRCHELIVAVGAVIGMHVGTLLMMCWLLSDSGITEDTDR